MCSAIFPLIRARTQSVHVTKEQYVAFIKSAVHPFNADPAVDLTSPKGG